MRYTVITIVITKTFTNKQLTQITDLRSILWFFWNMYAVNKSFKR